jgi:hypothetical protein
MGISCRRMLTERSVCEFSFITKLNENIQQEISIIQIQQLHCMSRNIFKDMWPAEK